MLKSFLRRFLKSRDPLNDPDTSAKLRLELALESSGLVDWDFNYERNTAHRGLRHDELYGYKEMLPSWNFDNFFHHVLPEYHELAKSKFANIPETGEISFEYQIRRVDGEIRWISLRGKGERNSSGKVVRVAGVLKDITEEKNLADKNSLQGKNIESLFQNSSEFFCVLNRDLVYEYVNPAHIRLFEGRNMTGLSVKDAQPELEGSGFINDLNRIFKTGETITFEDTPVQVGRRKLYVDMMYTPRRDAAGVVNGIYALGADVTAKIEALKKAQESAEQMKLITDKLPAFISYTDNQGRYQFLNKKYEEWFGIPLSEMIGKTREEITPSDYAFESKPFQTQALQGIPSHHHGIIRKADQALNLDIHFVPDFDPATKEVRGIVAVGVDVTLQTQALKEAEIARRELHELLMQAPAPMCLLTGPDYTFTMANPEYIRLVHRGEIEGKTLDEVFRGEDIELYRKIIREVYETGLPYLIKEAPFDVSDENGEAIHKYLNVGYHPYLDLQGKVKGVLVICLDVTEEVNSLKARDNFISVASHELKTPLTALKLQVQLQQKILKDFPDRMNFDHLSTFLTKSSSQLDRLDRLVNDMLEGSRTSAEKLAMQFGLHDFSQLVTETFQFYSPQLSSARMKVSLDIEPGIAFVFDDSRIEQVVLNIITNAIRYASGTALNVTVRKEGNEAVLEVKDHGPGIAKADQEIIFKRFGRVNQSRDVTGLGLGLFISKQIVENHKGSISVRSERGEGATFSVRLPLRKD